MSFEVLEDRLQALQETTSQLHTLIDRLANLKFQPGSVPLSSAPDDGNNPASELGSEISQILKEEEEDLELLIEEIADLRSGRPGSETEHAKARLNDGAKRLEAELRTCRVQFRKAQLGARRSLEAAQKLERELLLASYSRVASQGSSADPSRPDSPASGEGKGPVHTQLFPPGYRPSRKGKKEGVDGKEKLMDASSSVTAALRRTHALVSSELSRSEFAKQTLVESTAALESLHQNYSGLDNMLQSSKDLLSTLLTSNKSDTWYLEMTMTILFTTLAWLVFRRWIYGPVWWLVWLPIRTLWGVGKGAVAIVAGGGGGGSNVEVSAPDGSIGRVTGLDEQGRVPVATLRTGQEKIEERTKPDPDSMLDKVGRMLDEIETQLGDERSEDVESGDGLQDESQLNDTELEGQDVPNPKKRMWEEDKEAAQHDKAGSVRDEL
jgi:protein transport protein SEC20